MGLVAQPAFAFFRRQTPARPRIDWPVRPVGRGCAGGDLGSYPGSRAKAGVDKVQPLQPVQRLGVERQPLRLVGDLSVRLDAEPELILDDAVDMGRTGAAGVDVLDPQQHDTVLRPRMIMRQQRRISVAEVQPARRRGRESRDDIFHESRIIRSTRFPDAKPEFTFAGKRS